MGRAPTSGLQLDLHYRTEDPLTHAAKWLRPLSLESLAGFPDAMDRWRDYYRRTGIAAIAFGALILRRRAGAGNWTRFDDLRAGESSASAQVQRVFAAHDLLEAGSDLMAQRLRLVPEHRLDQSLHASEDAWELASSTLTLTDGITFTGTVDVATAELIRGLDGKRTLAEVVADRAPDFAADAVAMVRRLLELGFLEIRPQAD